MPNNEMPEVWLTPEGGMVLSGSKEGLVKFIRADKVDPLVKALEVIQSTINICNNTGLSLDGSKETMAGQISEALAEWGKK